MKKTLLTLVIALAGYCSYAQTNTFPGSGNVGIGTTSPITLFDVKLTTNQHIQFLSNVNGGYFGASGIVCINDANSAYTPLGFYASNYYLGGGNVGIGTTSPGEKLQVNGNIYVVKGGGSTLFLANSNYVSYVSSLENAGYSDLSLGAQNAECVRILGSNGNVGIGTTTPDAKLAVLGTIHAKEVKVDLGVLGPDYVFSNDYKLTNLNELKLYLENNHHLPEIPSAEQMAKDGINLSDMNVKLLKKVEELTLYLIKKDEQVSDQAKRIAEQNKKIEQQQQVNQSLQAQINELAKKLNK
jgi:hypothetical protein